MSNVPNGFRLIAIRPLENCNEKFTRVLKPGQLYPFYDSYDFVYKNDADPFSEVLDVIPLDTKGNKLYNIGKLPVNVSAIVGKNGSGKSSVIELFFAAIFILSVRNEVLTPNMSSMQKDWEKLDDRRHDISERKKKLEQDRERLKSWIDSSAFPLIPQALNDIEEKFRSLFEEQESIENEELSIADDELNIEFFRNEIHRLEFDLRAEIYYELDGTFYRIKIDFPESSENWKKEHVVLHELIRGSKREENLWTALNENNAIAFDRFFYSIAISYSHYALNSNSIGDWVNPLFHKNDGYQTPLVINPMRTEGNIDINTENELVQQRLILNIMEDIGDLHPNQSLRNLAPGKTAFAIELQYDEEKVTTYRERRIKSSSAYPSETFLNDLCHEYVGSNVIFDHGDQVVEGTKLYIENKLIRICTQYDRYKRYIQKGTFTNDRNLITLICKDNSHITFKLKQALNFLILGNYPISDGNKYYKDELDSFAESIRSEQKQARERGKHPNTIELLPPSIFRVRIKLLDGTYLDDLSSGEKQLIHSISSIVYHIININSVSENGEDRFNLEIKDLKSYNYVNIVFDEVEQYFHPELQREFVSKLLGYLSKMNPAHFNNIQGINLLFATHSPFILSDILNTNCLYLEVNENDDKSYPKRNLSQSFGANINDMLKSSFFMSSTLGEYAKVKANEIVHYYKSLKRETINHQEITELRKEYLLKRAELEEFISLLGEPVTRRILENHLKILDKNLLDENEEDRIKQKRIEELKAEIKRLEE